METTIRSGWDNNLGKSGDGLAWTGGWLIKITRIPLVGCDTSRDVECVNGIFIVSEFRRERRGWIEHPIPSIL